MLTLAWEYLLGRLMASDPTNRDLPEWPPHPDRVFQALVASWGETGQKIEHKRALEWLESLPHPALHIANPTDLTHPRSANAYVPVNDSAYSTSKANPPLRDLPIGRNRQPRTFPRLPVGQACYLVWRDAEEGDIQGHLPALRQLCLATASVGHSSSLVRMWVCEEEPPSGLHVYQPAEAEAEGGEQIRIPTRGRLSALITAYAGGGADWDRPPPSTWHAYRLLRPDGSPAIAQGVFSHELLILKTIGPSARRYGAAHIPALAETLRKTVMSNVPDGSRAMELVSGHDAGGKRLEEPHAAFIGLPFVGREHADGHLLGMAMVLPRQLPRHESDLCAKGLADSLNVDGSVTLKLGREGTLDLQAVDLGEERHNLLPTTWCSRRGSRTWATVTPIVLDYMPQRRVKDTDAFMEEVVAAACERTGLPRPDAVSLSEVSRFTGSPHSRHFRPMKRKSDGTNRWHLHATIRWADPVRGPVLVGAGRYRGMGLLRPLDERRSQ